jgi:hypothetical protein
MLVGAADHYIRRLTDEPKWDAVSNGASQYQYVWMWGGNGSSATYNLGSNGATATSVQLQYPEGMWLDTTHNALYVADQGNNVIRKIDLSVATPTISTVAGTGIACAPATASCGDGGAATSAQLNEPTGITGDASTNPPTLYVADYGDNKIRKVDSSGNISTIAGDGTADSTGNDDTAAAAAEVNGPYGITLSGSTLYFTENGSWLVRKITLGNAHIFKVAGTKNSACNSITNACGDGGSAKNATLYYPTTVIVDGSGRIVVDDWSDGRVRRFSDGGNISTIVGGGGGSIGGFGGAVGYRGDQGGAIGSYADPGGLAVGADGSLYVGTGGLVTTNIYGNGFRIRKVYVP